MTRRQLLALLALGGVFLSTYLALYHYGYIGSLACGTGGCEKVQGSNWAKFLGVPVAVWGVVFYGGVFVLAVSSSIVAPLVAAAWPSTALVAMNGVGVLFSGYLTYAEIAWIEAICRYCVVSACLVAVLLVVSELDRRDYRRVAK
jgi:uncharacterized membrane protein